MTPPINIDGTQITGASIDGQTVSEITVDGTQVFAAGPPDSAVVQFDYSKFSGGGTLTDDVQGITMSFSGGPTSETLSNGSNGIRGDGIDDVGTFPAPAELEGSSLQAFSWEISVQHQVSGLFEEGMFSGSDTSLRLVWNESVQNNSANGNFRAELFDDNGDLLRFGPDTNPNLDDGTLHKISIIVNDASNADVDIIIDGSSVTVGFNNGGSTTNFGTQDHDQAILARNNQGSIDSHGAIARQIERWHDSAISSQTI